MYLNFLSFFNLRVVQKSKQAKLYYKLSNGNICHHKLKNVSYRHFSRSLQGTNVQYLCAMFQYNRLCCYYFPYRISLFWRRGRLAINKHISRYQSTNLLRIWFLLLVSTEGQKRNKSKFATKFSKIIVTIIFI